MYIYKWIINYKVLKQKNINLNKNIQVKLLKK